MSILVVDLVAKLTSDTKDAIKDLKKTEQSFGDVAKFAGIMGVAVGAALLAVGVETTRMAGNFQASMTQLVTSGGELESNIASLGDQILQMGIDTGTSTAILTAGMLQAEKAGYHAGAGIDVLNASARAAKVTNTDLSVIIPIVTSEMTDYAYAHLTSAQAANVLIAANQRTNVGIDALAMGFKAIMPIASQLHIPIASVAGALDTMTNEGIKTKTASSELKTMFQGFEAPTKAMSKAMDGAGISAQDLNTSLSHGLPGTLRMILTAVGQEFPKGGAQYTAALKTMMGGTAGYNALLQLTGGNFQAYLANVNAITPAATGAGKSINGWSNVQADFNQKMDQAKQVVEAAGIKIGTALLPVAGQLADLFRTVMPKAVQLTIDIFTKAQAVTTELSAHFDQYKPVVFALAAAVGIVLVAAMVAYTAAAIGAAVATVTATWPVLAVAAAVGLLIAALVWAYQNWGWFRQGVDGARQNLQALGPMISTVWGWLGKLAGMVGSTVGTDFKTLGGIIKGVGDVLGGLGNIIGGVLGWLGRLRDAISSIHMPDIHVPGFAGGGITPGGIVKVGESGPEYAMFPAGTRIVSNQDASALMQGATVMGGGSSGSTSASGGGYKTANIYLVMPSGQVLAQAIRQPLVDQIRVATGLRV